MRSTFAHIIHRQRGGVLHKISSGEIKSSRQINLQLSGALVAEFSAIAFLRVLWCEKWRF